MTEKSDQHECPLCMEPLEMDDINFFPCTCGYQICRFCWHRIRTNENGLCPACRKQYPEDPAEYKPLTAEELQKIKNEKRQKDLQKKQKVSESRKLLSQVRVVQKNLLFVVGLTQKFADPEILKKNENFGRFGKINKVVINTSTNYAGTGGPTASAYITYFKSDDALRAVHYINHHPIMDGRNIKASLGTTKYCSHFLKGTICPKTDCMYLHEMGEEGASFTKEDMQAGKHQEYEMKLLENCVNNTTNSSTTTSPLAIATTNSPTQISPRYNSTTCVPPFAITPPVEEELCDSTIMSSTCHQLLPQTTSPNASILTANSSPRSPVIQYHANSLYYSSSDTASSPSKSSYPISKSNSINVVTTTYSLDDYSCYNGNSNLHSPLTNHSNNQRDDLAYEKGIVDKMNSSTKDRYLPNESPYSPIQNFKNSSHNKSDTTLQAITCDNITSAHTDALAHPYHPSLSADERYDEDKEEVESNNQHSGDFDSNHFLFGTSADGPLGYDGNYNNHPLISPNPRRYQQSHNSYGAYKRGTGGGRGERQNSEDDSSYYYNNYYNNTNATEDDFLSPSHPNHKTFSHPSSFRRKYQSNANDFSATDVNNPFDNLDSLDRDGKTLKTFNKQHKDSSTTTTHPEKGNTNATKSADTLFGHFETPSHRNRNNHDDQQSNRMRRASSNLQTNLNSLNNNYYYDNDEETEKFVDKDWRCTVSPGSTLSTSSSTQLTQSTFRTPPNNNSTKNHNNHARDYSTDTIKHILKNNSNNTNSSNVGKSNNNNNSTSSCFYDDSALLRHNRNSSYNNALYSSSSRYYETPYTTDSQISSYSTINHNNNSNNSHRNHQNTSIAYRNSKKQDGQQVNKNNDIKDVFPLKSNAATTTTTPSLSCDNKVGSTVRNIHQDNTTNGHKGGGGSGRHQQYYYDDNYFMGNSTNNYSSYKHQNHHHQYRNNGYCNHNNNNTNNYSSNNRTLTTNNNGRLLKSSNSNNNNHITSLTSTSSNPPSSHHKKQYNNANNNNNINSSSQSSNSPSSLNKGKTISNSDIITLIREINSYKDNDNTDDATNNSNNTHKNNNPRDDFYISSPRNNTNLSNHKKFSDNEFHSTSYRSHHTKPTSKDLPSLNNKSSSTNSNKPANQKRIDVLLLRDGKRKILPNHVCTSSPQALLPPELTSPIKAGRTDESHSTIASSFANTTQQSSSADEPLKSNDLFTSDKSGNLKTDKKCLTDLEIDINQGDKKFDPPDWQEAFGFGSSKLDTSHKNVQDVVLLGKFNPTNTRENQIEGTVNKSQLTVNDTDNDLGFDPWNESTKALEEMIQLEEDSKVAAAEAANSTSSFKPNEIGIHQAPPNYNPSQSYLNLSLMNGDSSHQISINNGNNIIYSNEEGIKSSHNLLSDINSLNATNDVASLIQLQKYLSNNPEAGMSMVLSNQNYLTAKQNQASLDFDGNTGTNSNINLNYEHSSFNSVMHHQGNHSGNGPNSFTLQQASSTARQKQFLAQFLALHLQNQQQMVQSSTNNNNKPPFLINSSLTNNSNNSTVASNSININPFVQRQNCNIPLTFDQAKNVYQQQRDNLNPIIPALDLQAPSNASNLLGLQQLINPYNPPHMFPSQQLKPGELPMSNQTSFTNQLAASSLNSSIGSWWLDNKFRSKDDSFLPPPTNNTINVSDGSSLLRNNLQALNHPTQQQQHFQNHINNNNTNIFMMPPTSPLNNDEALANLLLSPPRNHKAFEDSSSDTATSFQPSNEILKNISPTQLSECNLINRYPELPYISKFKELLALKGDIKLPTNNDSIHDHLLKCSNDEGVIHNMINGSPGKLHGENNTSNFDESATNLATSPYNTNMVELLAHLLAKTHVNSNKIQDMPDNYNFNNNNSISSNKGSFDSDNGNSNFYQNFSNLTTGYDDSNLIFLEGELNTQHRPVLPAAKISHLKAMNSFDAINDYNDQQPIKESLPKNTDKAPNLEYFNNLYNVMFQRHQLAALNLRNNGSNVNPLFGNLSTSPTAPFAASNMCNNEHNGINSQNPNVSLDPGEGQRNLLRNILSNPILANQFLQQMQAHINSNNHQSSMPINNVLNNENNLSSKKANFHNPIQQGFSSENNFNNLNDARGSGKLKNTNDKLYEDNLASFTAKHQASNTFMQNLYHQLGGGGGGGSSSSSYTHPNLQQHYHHLTNMLNTTVQSNSKSNEDVTKYLAASLGNQNKSIDVNDGLENGVIHMPSTKGHGEGLNNSNGLFNSSSPPFPHNNNGKEMLLDHRSMPETSPKSKKEQNSFNNFNFPVPRLDSSLVDTNFLFTS